MLNLLRCKLLTKFVILQEYGTEELSNFLVKVFIHPTQISQKTMHILVQNGYV